MPKKTATDVADLLYSSAGRGVSICAERFFLGNDAAHRKHTLTAARGAGVPGDDLYIEDGKRREQDDLQDTVESDQHCAVIAVASRQVGPDEHHRDAPRNPDEDQPIPQLLAIREERPSERHHEERRKNPVDHEGDGDLLPELLGPQEQVQGFEPHFAEDGEHHDQQADGDRRADPDELALLERWAD